MEFVVSWRLLLLKANMTEESWHKKQVAFSPTALSKDDADNDDGGSFCFGHDGTVKWWACTSAYFSEWPERSQTSFKRRTEPWPGTQTLQGRIQQCSRARWDHVYISYAVWKQYLPAWCWLTEQNTLWVVEMSRKGVCLAEDAKRTKGEKGEVLWGVCCVL